MNNQVQLPAIIHVWCLLLSESDPILLLCALQAMATRACKPHIQALGLAFLRHACKLGN